MLAMVAEPAFFFCFFSVANFGPPVDEKRNYVNKKYFLADEWCDDIGVVFWRAIKQSNCPAAVNNQATHHRYNISSKNQTGVKLLRLSRLMKKKLIPQSPGDIRNQVTHCEPSQPTQPRATSLKPAIFPPPCGAQ